MLLLKLLPQCFLATLPRAGFVVETDAFASPLTTIAPRKSGAHCTSVGGGALGEAADQSPDERAGPRMGFLAAVRRV